MAYSKQWYQDNRDVVLARTKLRNERVRDENNAKLKEIKETSPCTDCREFHPYYVMQFDHTADDKEASVGNMRHCSWSKIQKEIDKCELVCANCHAKRTWKRQHAP